MRVVAGLAVRAGRVFLAKRPQGKPRPGLWEYPGGKVEHGEGEHHALIREWWEELGVTVAVGTHVATISFTIDTPIELVLYHVVMPWGAEVVLKEHDEAGWFIPEVAARDVACSPGTYLLHMDVVAFLEHAVQPAHAGGE